MVEASIKEQFSEQKLNYGNFYVPDDSNLNLVKGKLGEIYGIPYEHSKGALIYNHEEGNSVRNWVILQDVPDSSSFAYTISSGSKISGDFKKVIFDLAMKNLEKVCLKD